MTDGQLDGRTQRCEQLAEGGLLKYLAKGSLPNDRCDPLIESNGR
jgi:hypothetical protein